MSAPNAATHPQQGATINEAQRPSGTLIAAGLATLLLAVYSILRRDALFAALDELRHAYLVADTYYQAALATYAAATVLYLGSIFTPGRGLYILARLVMAVGIAFNIAQVATRWVESGRPPFKTLYEVSIYISMIVALINTALEFMKGARLVSFLVGILLMVVGAYALKYVDSEVVKIPPALQNFIFIPHVTVYITAYSAMAIAFITGILYLVWPKKMVIEGDSMKSRMLANMLGGREVDYEFFTYGIIKFAFVFLTIGLVLGSVWGKQAWADWWFWDPKENWALITWMVYLGYLHMRKEGKFRGRKAVIFSLIGFTAVTFTYIGMKYLPVADQSEHVYTD